MNRHNKRTFPFSFIKYTQPGWQFNVMPVTGKPVATAYYHPVHQPHKAASLHEDVGYETDTARWTDVGYRNLQGGYMTFCSEEEREAILSLPSPSLNDEYRFVAKYWGGFFSVFALICRLAGLHNPIKEIAAFTRSLKVKKVELFVPLVNDKQEYETFESALVAQQPLVSVIIPTLNRYTWLKDALHDLVQQHYSNFEVIIIDQSENFDEAFYDQFNLRLKVQHQKEKLLWTARNKAIQLSDADYLLFFDDDSRVEPDWILQHLKALEYYKADISAGVSLATIGGKIPKGYKYFKWADQFDSGNALVKRSVFEKIGLFDLQYNKMRQGDGEFGFRAFRNGFVSISNPLAKRVHLKVKDGGLREIGSWDGFRQKKWFQPKPVPSVLFQYKKYLTADLAKHAVLIGLLLSNVHLKHKRNKYMLVVSSLMFIIKSPLLYYQYRKSKKIAEAMLLRDNGIQPLKQVAAA
ncbi:glycosyltransferase family 2 protein [Aridibaculum aurantiacum]|uniref:glycosyltransferase family 2 protein n=1 Tax=Aridibaculum aurantiacum TaxID=2810307 RepID=UPI001A95C848|nr:glycosyltransferase family A protein [Aridibaculum aurantiacum]